jgi:purine-nucleoside phosphorylase
VGTPGFGDIEAAAGTLGRRCGPFDTALVLGSGLGECAGALSDTLTIPYHELPGWPQSTVAGHAGRLVVGAMAGRRIAVLDGRAHLYEGYDAKTVVFPVRVMGRLGVKQLILTSAAGGINSAFTPGTLMVIDDHLNFQGNPLVGPNDDRLGPRFPDMTEVYSSRLRAAAAEAGKAAQLDLAHGVYAGLVGPSYETPAEIRYLRALGADAVGMSTAVEAVAARHMGLEVLGICCIVNMAAGVTVTRITHDDVLLAAGQASRSLVVLLEEILGRL